MSDARERDPQPPPAWRGYARWTLRGALGAALAIGGAWAWDAVAHAEALRMRTVFVGGAFARVGQAEVFAQVRPHLTANFLQLDLAAVRADVEALPWVARAAVRREWPGTLRIEFTEEVPVATWQGKTLLNADAVAFATLDPAAADAAALPALAGPDGTAALVLASLRDMQRAAGERLAPIARVELSERRAWEVWFADGTRVRLGRRDALARLARFAEVVAPLIVPQTQHVAYVDMRYANGFTVGWRGAPLAPTTPERAGAGAKASKRKRTDV
jgi:cell division protein FtsQ